MIETTTNILRNQTIWSKYRNSPTIYPIGKSDCSSSVPWSSKGTSITQTSKTMNSMSIKPYFIKPFQSLNQISPNYHHDYINISYYILLYHIIFINPISIIFLSLTSLNTISSILSIIPLPIYQPSFSILRTLLSFYLIHSILQSPIQLVLYLLFLPISRIPTWL